MLKQSLFPVPLVPVFILLMGLLLPTVSMGNTPGHPGEPALSLQQRGEFFLFRKQYDEALDIFKTLVEEGTEDSSLFRGLIRAYQGSGKLNEAESFMQTFLSAHPQSSSAHYGLGYYYYLVENDAAAQKQFETAVSLDPQNSLALNNFGASLARTKSYTYAVEKVKQAIALDPSNPLFFNNLRRIYGEMGTPGVFFAEFQGYVKEGPGLVTQGYGKVIARTLRQEAFKLYSQGQIDQSIEKFAEIVEIYQEIQHREGLVPVYFGLGVLFEEKGEAGTAKEYFEKVLAINPDHIQAREKIK